MGTGRMMSVPIVVILMIFGRVMRSSSDFAQDKMECQDQLMSLAPCIGFISEEETSPSPVCCIRLGDNYDQKRKCLCMLVRDRNDPNVGFHINATLALSLPFLCHIPANVTQCLDFLHLDPQSPEAQIFKQPYANIFGSNSTITSNGNSQHSSPSSSSSSTNHRMKGLTINAQLSVWLLILSIIIVISSIPL